VVRNVLRSGSHTVTLAGHRGDLKMSAKVSTVGAVIGSPRHYCCGGSRGRAYFIAGGILGGEGRFGSS